MSIHPAPRTRVRVSPLLSMQGCVCLVTGGAGGIGSSIGEQLTEMGAQVVSVDVDESDVEGSQVCDVSDPAQVRGLVERVVEQHGRLDVLVHAAGITRDRVLWKMADEDWDHVLSVNLSSAFHLLKAAAPHLRASPRGSVVLISSINGERGKFGQANYAASKAGLIGLARTAAKELGASGVRVNVVAPGLIATPMTADLPFDVVATAVDESALQRVGTAQDVARAVLFLCSEMSGHVTGQVLRVDGGQLMA
jgi:3-oxoacyl-[acyl-carrier protein] reductase